MPDFYGSEELLVLVLGIFAALTIMLGFSYFKSMQRPVPAGYLADHPNDTIFVFADHELVDASPSALIYLEDPLNRHSAWQRLMQKIEPLSPLVKDRISDLEKSGRAFDLQLGSREHPFRVEACQEGGLTRITLDQSTSSADQSSRDQDAKAAMTNELDQLREIVDCSPLLAWRQHQNGDIVWASKSYFETLRQMRPEREQFGWPLPVLMAPPLQVADHNSRSSVRVPINFPGNENPAWYEVYSFETPDQSRLNFALLADPVVKAEEALRNFVQTLTKTFAHLPIGLAIFDKQRKLALFNPALTDLTALKPEWLSQRPTLFGFWDKLRENRHMPEPKDYPSWRRKMVALEESAVSGAYEENWFLPGGQTYKVTGRPHPEGAVAFLFEDISASVSLQQKFRAEMELCQSLIDNLPQAVAVFALGGELTLSNDAFADLWGSDPSTSLERTNITMATQLWQSKCLPTPIWGDLRDFVGIGPERSEWTAEIHLKTGEPLEARFSPLSNGATLCSFSHSNPAPEQCEPRF